MKGGMRAAHLVPCERGWQIWLSHSDGGGFEPLPLIGWALTDAGTVEGVWHDGERVVVGTKPWPVTAPGEAHKDWAGAAAEAIATRDKESNDRSTAPD
jgi:hypothetical protein